MDEHQSGIKLEEVLEAKKELDAKAQKILEEKEADSRMRTYTGPLGRAGPQHLYKFHRKQSIQMGNLPI